MGVLEAREDAEALIATQSPCEPGQYILRHCILGETFATLDGWEQYFRSVMNTAATAASNSTTKRKRNDDDDTENKTIITAKKKSNNRGHDGLVLVSTKAAASMIVATSTVTAAAATTATATTSAHIGSIPFSPAPYPSLPFDDAAYSSSFAAIGAPSSSSSPAKKAKEKNSELVLWSPAAAARTAKSMTT